MGRTCCVQKLFLTFRTIFVHNMFSPCSAKRRASDKDLPVLVTWDFKIKLDKLDKFLHFHSSLQTICIRIKFNVKFWF